MKGWEIFIHSVRLVFSNLTAALQISLVPYLIGAVVLIAFGGSDVIAMDGATPEEMMAQGVQVSGGALLSLLVAFLTSLWIAVAWHRYVLLEEYPTGWVPAFHGGPIASYFLKGLLVGLVIVIAVGLLTTLLSAALAMFGQTGVTLSVMLGMAAGAYVFYRLCPILPAAAVGENMSITQAWQSTSGITDSIVVLVVLFLLFSIFLQIPAMFGGDFNLIGTAYGFVANWIATLVGISVLTSFYGHFVEGRPID